MLYALHDGGNLENPAPPARGVLTAIGGLPIGPAVVKVANPSIRAILIPFIPQTPRTRTSIPDSAPRCCRYRTGLSRSRTKEQASERAFRWA